MEIKLVLEDISDWYWVRDQIGIGRDQIGIGREIRLVLGGRLEGDQIDVGREIRLVLEEKKIWRFSPYRKYLNQQSPFFVNSRDTLHQKFYRKRSLFMHEERGTVSWMWGGGRQLRKGQFSNMVECRI